MLGTGNMSILVRDYIYAKYVGKSVLRREGKGMNSSKESCGWLLPLYKRHQNANLSSGKFYVQKGGKR